MDWYDRPNINKSNWYDEQNVKICASCDSYIYNGSDLCQSCQDFIQKKINSFDIKKFMDKFNSDGYSFLCEHIPYFSAITACYKDTDIITVGVDWDYVEITDEILDCDKYIYQDNKNIFNNIISNLLKFIYDLGGLMYSDIFDSDALVSSSDYFVSNFINNKNFGWKAIKRNEAEEWLEQDFIPKNTIFSLAKYFCVERNHAIDQNILLVKLKSKKYDIVIRRNSTFKVKNDIPISDVEFNIKEY